MTIKAHCMGMEFPQLRVDNNGGMYSRADDVLLAREFPKRDTDSPNVSWELPSNRICRPMTPDEWGELVASALLRTAQTFGKGLPSAADLDAVAEEQRVKEKTS